VCTFTTAAAACLLHLHNYTGWKCGDDNDDGRGWNGTGDSPAFRVLFLMKKIIIHNFFSAVRCYNFHHHPSVSGRRQLGGHKMFIELKLLLMFALK